MPLSFDTSHSASVTTHNGFRSCTLQANHAFVMLDLTQNEYNLLTILHVWKAFPLWGTDHTPNRADHHHTATSQTLKPNLQSQTLCAPPLTFLSTMPSSSHSTATSAPSRTPSTVVFEHDYLIEEILAKLGKSSPPLQPLLYPALDPAEDREQKINRRALVSVALTSRQIGEIASRLLWRHLDQKGLGHFIHMIQNSLITHNTYVSSPFLLS